MCLSAKIKGRDLFTKGYFVEPKAAEEPAGALEPWNSESESCLRPRCFLSVTLSYRGYMASDLLSLLLDLLNRQHFLPLCARMGQELPLHKGRLNSSRYMFSLAATQTSVNNVNAKVPEKRIILAQGFTSVLINYGQIWLLHKEAGLENNGIES